jgi:hypothetical protein
MQALIVESGDPRWMIRFARDVAMADKSLLLNRLVKSRRPQHVFRFACEISDPDILDQAAKGIVSISDPQWMYEFARRFPSYSEILFDAACKAVRKTRGRGSLECRWIEAFARNVAGIDIERAANTLIECAEFAVRHRAHVFPDLLKTIPPLCLFYERFPEYLDKNRVCHVVAASGLTNWSERLSSEGMDCDSASLDEYENEISIGRIDSCHKLH